MIFGIYAMKDRLTGFLQPTLEQNDSCAVRNFQTALQQSKDVMKVFPSDFSLYTIGTYDTISGVICSCDPRFICDGSSFESGDV